MRYANRTDSNHAEVRDGLRKIPGVYVLDLSVFPGIGADLLVRYQDRAPVFIEVKASPKDRLTPNEKKLSKSMVGYWHRVTTLEEAFDALGIAYERAPGDW